MKTTLEIPDDLLREAKEKAALQGIKLKDLVASALRRELDGGATDRPAAGSMARKRRPVEAAKLGQRTEFPLLKPGRRPFPYLTNALIEEIFSEEDADYYGRFMRR